MTTLLPIATRTAIDVKTDGTATNPIRTDASPAAATATPVRLPPTEGLYRADREHDACGVGFVANIHNEPSHQIVEMGLEILVNLTHRGAVGADPEMGDGAGMLVQVPHELLTDEAARLGFELPAKGEYAVGMVFLPPDDLDKTDLIERVVAAEGQRFLGWRDVPVNSDAIPASVRASEPVIKQFFVARGEGIEDETAFERRLYLVRKVISNTAYDGRPPAQRGFVICSLSCRTLVYKGMFLAHQLGAYYPDLSDPRLKSAMALVHQRFSTNTFPSWGLAHPYRMVAHNGEINTPARQRQLDGGASGERLLAPVRRGDRQAVADLLRGAVRHGVLRQRARIPRAGGLRPRPRDGDARARGLGRQPADG